VVENTVQHHPQSGGVEGVADLLKVLVCAQAAVDMRIIPGVIAVLVAVKNGVKEDRVRARALDMLDPVQHAENPM
jgi:hypothetical protein